MLHAVVMAGGSGTRFWPLSRRNEPKQFLRLSGDRSLIQMAFDRTQPWIDAINTWVVTNARMVDQTAAHLPQTPSENILSEPCARNTAPCIGLAALCLLEKDSDATMLVMPADHVIGPHAAFQKSVEQAERIVQGDPHRLVLFGVPPTYPSTGFGYIERAEADASSSGAYRVASFREKPARDTAEDYLRQGTFYWNCGIFVWKASRILSALQEYEPEMYRLLQELQPHVGKNTWSAALADVFPNMKSISIDYAILERDSNITVVEAPYDWDDVGSWTAMQRLQPADENGNTIIGLHVGIDTNGCIIRSSQNHVISTIGIKDCIIVHTPDATLVADRHDENAVREIVALLEKNNYEQYL